MTQKDLKDYLTNEEILKRFKSQFKVVLYAMDLAKNYVESGRTAMVKTEIANPAHVVLTEILNQKETFAPILKDEEGNENDVGVG